MSHKEGGERESEREREHTNEGGNTVWLKEKAKEKEERKENEKVSGLLKEVVCPAPDAVIERDRASVSRAKSGGRQCCCTGINTAEDVDIGVDIGVAAAALIQRGNRPLLARQ